MKFLNFEAVLIFLITIINIVKGGSKGLYQGGIAKTSDYQSKIVFDDIPIEAVEAIKDSITARHIIMNTEESENNIKYLFESLLDNDSASSNTTTIAVEPITTTKADPTTTTATTPTVPIKPTPTESSTTIYQHSEATTNETIEPTTTTTTATATTSSKTNVSSTT